MLVPYLCRVPPTITRCRKQPPHFCNSCISCLEDSYRVPITVTVVLWHLHYTYSGDHIRSTLRALPQQLVIQFLELLPYSCNWYQACPIVFSVGFSNRCPDSSTPIMFLQQLLCLYNYYRITVTARLLVVVLMFFWNSHRVSTTVTALL